MPSSPCQIDDIDDSYALLVYINGRKGKATRNEYVFFKEMT
jgi:hypothetical protein